MPVWFDNEDGSSSSPDLPPNVQGKSVTQYTQLHTSASWPEDWRIALCASTNAYAYDKANYAKNLKTWNTFCWRQNNNARSHIYKQTVDKPFEVCKTPHNDDDRENPNLPKAPSQWYRLLQYVPEYSSNTFAVWVEERNANSDVKTIVVAFRGTDITDPVRYINFIPTNWELLLAEQIDVAHNLNKTINWPNNYNALSPKAKIEYIRVNQNTNSFQNKNVTLREMQTKALGQLTNFQICAYRSSPLQTNESEIKPKVLVNNWNILEGGKEVPTANPSHPYSDAAADCAITAVQTNFTTGIVSDKDYNKLYNDPKHARAATFLQAVLREEVKDFSFHKIIVTGHSLGGSLGCYALLKHFINGNNKYFGDHIDYKFIGFNSGTLSNFNKLAIEANKRTHLDEVFLGIRNRDDTVSGGLAYKGVPNFMNTLNFVNAVQYDKSPAWVDTDIATHGLNRFNEESVILSKFNPVF